MYPVARGTAPVVVLLVSTLALGVSLPPLAIAGIVLVALGVVLVRGFRDAPDAAQLALALAIGCCIAAYTLVDKRGIRYAAPLAYLEVVFATLAVAYLAAVWSARGSAAIRRACSPAIAVAGFGFFGSYALTLLALTRAAAAPVAAVRKTSVLLVTAVAARALHERVTSLRVVGACLVVAGAAAIALR